LVVALPVEVVASRVEAEVLRRDEVVRAHDMRSGSRRRGWGRDSGAAQHGGRSEAELVQRGLQGAGQALGVGEVRAGVTGVALPGGSDHAVVALVAAGIGVAEKQKEPVVVDETLILDWCRCGQRGRQSSDRRGCWAAVGVSKGTIVVKVHLDETRETGSLGEIVALVAASARIRRDPVSPRLVVAGGVLVAAHFRLAVPLAAEFVNGGRR
jgi:hypothetical protein